MTQCQMIIGYLIPRQCENKARQRCVKCGRAVCDEHATITDAGVVCAACAGVLHEVEEAPVIATRPVYLPSERELFETTEEDIFADMS